MTARRTPARRTTAPLAVGAVLALTLAACGDDGADDGATDPGASPSTPTSSATATTTPSDDEGGTGGGTGGAGTGAVPVYYVLEGDRAGLVREFHAGQGDDALASAVTLLSSPPSDPDYTSYVDGWVTAAQEADGEIVATVSGPVPGDDAELAVQQVVYTLQAAAGRVLPVRFLGESGGDAVGLPGTNPVSTSPELETLALVNITDPAEGTTVSGSMTATGRASSPENNVRWEVRSGSEVVLEGFTTHEGSSTDERLDPWTVEVDLSTLAPGTYTFVAMTDDASGGEEGSGPATDTRTIVVG
ncbi:Gmad2 immunoglobulin-like domain-containing protein [Nocardioides sp. ChNu-153]|uniref:Gmad2 immunoglobulin-like domain-containing protein n=1 Tax=unclassified Nocardioides TaxID=2615069 RepID=UPI0024062191|nr:MULTISPECIES: Gmad2 immunoglobulin-like domain-containing protein [unclassified Nocardioides]MDF9715505.1 Gmad2 immunoglobulin-like domain-containing protein [Nocardioides sp. ChNu-99]MDN7120739.1 Gmad2 immunoglobulin-like domain-containing protein [Nocardioides sp. ChNu-153]